MVEKDYVKKYKEKHNIMSWFWYTLKNLDPDVKVFWEIWVQICR
jgi:hypothetical protein